MSRVSEEAALCVQGLLVAGQAHCYCAVGLHAVVAAVRGLPHSPASSSAADVPHTCCVDSASSLSHFLVACSIPVLLCHMRHPAVSAPVLPDVSTAMSSLVAMHVLAPPPHRHPSAQQPCSCEALQYFRWAPLAGPFVCFPRSLCRTTQVSHPGWCQLHLPPVLSRPAGSGAGWMTLPPAPRL